MLIGQYLSSYEGRYSGTQRNGREGDAETRCGRLAIKLSKCEISVNQLTWLEYDINEDGYSPKFSKIDAIQSLKPPRTLKQLRSFMGTLNHLQRFIPDLHTQV